MVVANKSTPQCS